MVSHGFGVILWKVKVSVRTWSMKSCGLCNHVWAVWEWPGTLPRLVNSLPVTIMLHPWIMWLETYCFRSLYQSVCLSTNNLACNFSSVHRSYLICILLGSSTFTCYLSLTPRWPRCLHHVMQTLLVIRSSDTDAIFNLISEPVFKKTD